jgi:hypothetical protein
MKKSDYTKNLISERLKESKSDLKHRNKMMILTQKQHLGNKFELSPSLPIGFLLLAISYPESCCCYIL